MTTDGTPQGQGGDKNSAIGAVIFLLVLGYFAWHFNMFGMFNKFKPLPQIEVGKDIAIMGVTLSDWKYDGSVAISGKIVSTKLPISGHSIHYSLFGNNKEKLSQGTLSFPSLRVGEVGVCEIVYLDMKKVDTVVISELAIGPGEGQKSK